MELEIEKVSANIPLKLANFNKAYSKCLTVFLLNYNNVKIASKNRIFDPSPSRNNI